MPVVTITRFSFNKTQQLIIEETSRMGTMENTDINHFKSVRIDIEIEERMV